MFRAEYYEIIMLLHFCLKNNVCDTQGIKKYFNEELPFKKHGWDSFQT